MSFRTYLAWAAAGILLPILILSTIALLLLMRAEREAAQRGVRDTAHAIVLASDGASGVRAAKDLRPDVAIIDIGMPELDGYEVAKALRKSANPTMLLIALTGYGQPEDERRAKAAGFDAHLVKPADIAEIKKLLSDRQPSP